jgi:hypothetical protein
MVSRETPALAASASRLRPAAIRRWRTRWDIDAATDDAVLDTVDIFTFTSTLVLERCNLAPLPSAENSGLEHGDPNPRFGEHIAPNSWMVSIISDS